MNGFTGADIVALLRESVVNAVKIPSEIKLEEKQEEKKDIDSSENEDSNNNNNNIILEKKHIE